MEVKLQAIRDHLALRKDAYTRELDTMPEGKLLVTRSNNHERWYVVTRQNGKPKRCGVKSKPWLACQYARKEYLLRMIPRLESNMAVLDKAIAKSVSCNPYDVVCELSETFQRIPTEAYFNPLGDPEMMSFATPEQRIAAHVAWGEDRTETGGFHEEGLVHKTSFGLSVRSKAEILIAEKLHEYGIPFKYEQELVLYGGTVHPDFTFEGAGGKPFYLEFCGMMDDEEYAKRFIRKRRLYEDNGINDWTNIIYVFATGNNMDMTVIDYVIRKRIIPWL